MNALPNIPTAISPREVALLQHVVRGKRVVEFGALLGFSTVIMARVAASVVSIDKHTGYTGPTFREFRSNLYRFGVNELVRSIEGDAALFETRAQQGIAFIDLTGKYELTRAVVERLDCGLIAMHDCSRPYCEVDRVVRDLGLKPLAQVESLVVCCGR